MIIYQSNLMSTFTALTLHNLTYFTKTTEHKHIGLSLVHGHSQVTPEKTQERRVAKVDRLLQTGRLFPEG